MGMQALVVIGTPSPARASRARVLFRLLLAGARQRIDITSPYFLPDRSARGTPRCHRAQGQGARHRSRPAQQSSDHAVGEPASVW